jgi:hypothetical protein
MVEALLGGMLSCVRKFGINGRMIATGGFR